MRLGPIILLFLTVATGCDDTRRNAISMTGCDPDKGRQKFIQYGCGACHAAAGVSEASAAVGPPLKQVGSRPKIGGVLENTPENMIRWIQDPPSFSPKTAMPNLHVRDEDAKDITCFLYTLR
jgi:cytochrome c2